MKRSAVCWTSSSHSATVQYDEAMIEAMEKHAIQDGKKGGGGADAEEDAGSDPMFKQAVEVVIDAGQASTSLLQRRCKLGYARAARIMDEMEQKEHHWPLRGRKAPRRAHQPPAVAGNADEPTGGIKQKRARPLRQCLRIATSPKGRGLGSPAKFPVSPEALPLGELDAKRTERARTLPVFNQE